MATLQQAHSGNNGGEIRGGGSLTMPMWMPSQAAVTTTQAASASAAAEAPAGILGDGTDMSIIPSGSSNGGGDEML